MNMMICPVNYTAPQQGTQIYKGEGETFVLMQGCVSFSKSSDKRKTNRGTLRMGGE